MTAVPTPAARPSTCQRLALVPIMLLLAVLTGLPGSAVLPPEAHEVFVLRTAQEMVERGDWLVPYFNDRPRLNKPPLNYWLTAFVATVSGSARNIEPLHARLVSLLAALAMVAVTFTLARQLLNRRCATWSSLILLTCLGFFSFAHDGRPDMLYAMLCSLACLSLVCARGATSRAPRLAWLGLAWCALGLATLCKGPHMPLAFLLAWVIALKAEGLDWRRVVALVAPLPGMVLWLLIVLPWWVLLRARLGDDGLAGTQLSGILLRPDPSHPFTMHYTYATFLLVLPWLLLVPASCLALKAERRSAPALRLLALWVVVPALILSLGPQARNVYMLPCLMPLCILLAAGMRELQALYRRRAWTGVVAVFVALQLIVPLALMARRIAAHIGHDAAVWSAWLMTATAVAALAASLGRRVTPHRLVVGTALALVPAYAVLAGSGSSASPERVELARLAVAAVARAPTPVVTFRREADVIVFYARRRVPELTRLQEIRQMLRDSDSGRLVVMTNHAEMSNLGKIAPLTPLARPALAEDRGPVVVELQRP